MCHNKYRNKSGGLSLSAFRSVSKVVGRGVYCSSGTIFTHHSADMYLLCHFLAAKCSAIYGSIWFNSPGSNSYPIHWKNEARCAALPDVSEASPALPYQLSVGSSHDSELSVTKT